MSLSESRIIELALENLEEQRRGIEAQIYELRSKMNDQRRGRIAEPENQDGAPPAKHRRKGRRQMTAEEKQAISKRMKQRWAEHRAAKT